ncbi:MAG: hypothetical protein AAGJ93_10835 [Bacteroidota bacterium]
MNVLGLIVELLLLALGVYVYLFSRGLIQLKDPEREERAQAFRQENGSILRLMSLALAAVMLINLLLRLQQAFS